MMKAILVISLFLYGPAILGQSVSINNDGSNAHNAAMLDIKSSTKGLLIPRLTKTERNAVAAPPNGLLVFQTGPDSVGFYYHLSGEWKWLADSKRSDNSYWSLHGNNYTTPPSSSHNVAINYATDTYFGTFMPEDVSFVAGGNELIRLKTVSGGGRIGFQNRNPEYALDIRMTDFSNTPAIQGLRMVPQSLFDMNSNVNIDKGLVIGTMYNNPKETMIWNYGNNINAAIRLGFDMHGGSARPAVNITQDGLGIYESSPTYMLDMHSFSQFNTAYPWTTKNGARITFNGQQGQNLADRGLFMGVDMNNTYKSYVWNYADGQDQNDPNRSIYFGVGSDPTWGSNRPTILMQNGIVSLGHVNPSSAFPSILNIQTDYDASIAKKGISVMGNFNGPETAYLGSDQNDNLTIFKYNGGNIFMGSPFADGPITINSSNYVGIRTTTPNAELQFDDNYTNNKIVLHNNHFGNIPHNDHDFYGFGVNYLSMRYQVPRNFTDHIFYAGNNAGTASNELMRINGNGYVGIVNPTPTAPLHFNSAPENRKIVLADFGSNNDHNFFGFGRTNGELRYQVSSLMSDHVFYAGTASFSSLELMRVLGNGNIGMGTNYPVGYGHTGNMKILELKNPDYGNDVQSHLILSGNTTLGKTGGITWASNVLSGETRTGFIGNSIEPGNSSKLSFHTRSSGNILAERFYVLGDGNAWLQGTLTQASDARLKTNITRVTDPLTMISQINGYSYNWIDSHSDNNAQMGVLAQEVQKVYPQLVKQDANGELSVNYIGLIPVLLEGMKEQQKQLDEQRKLIDKLIRKADL